MKIKPNWPNEKLEMEIRNENNEKEWKILKSLQQRLKIKIVLNLYKFWVFLDNHIINYMFIKNIGMM